MLHLRAKVAALTSKIIRKQTQVQVVMKIITYKAQEIGEMIGGASPPEMSAHDKVKNLRLMEY